MIHPESAAQLFFRFLRFGALAWGGPVAQIGMLKKELVDEERWVSQEQFRRSLAVYQVLPGPEAHELCVWLGTLRHGRLGGLLAGLGFMLPGLVLTLLLAWCYTAIGSWPPSALAAFAGMQAAVIALIARATHRIAQHAVTDRVGVTLALIAAASTLLGVHFAIPLAGAGLLYVAWPAKNRSLIAAIALAWLGATVALLASGGVRADLVALAESAGPAPTSFHLLGSGLRAGLLTFGGAYTAIPFLQEDAVGARGWMTAQQFLDGVALTGVLPAPLIIIGTFVGWIGGAFSGALLMTAGIFAPAFGFTLIGHSFFERLVAKPGVHRFLDGISAAVVGLIAATAIQLAPVAAGSIPRALIAIAALILLYRLKRRWAVPAVVGAAALLGVLAC
ncbi:MAG: chromate efflux transporter [Planctomycetes bacterium]|nr:chromate efflux transporter [Planctomycetota bacterium]